MMVDPIGEDEYFNKYGFYLGSDNSESMRMILQRAIRRHDIKHNQYEYRERITK